MSTSRSVYHRRHLTGPVMEYRDLAWDMGDAEIEARVDTYTDWLYLMESEGDAESADFVRMRLAELDEVRERKIALRDQHADDPRTPFWTPSKAKEYEQLKALVDWLRQRWPIAQFLTELMAIDLQPAGPERMKGLCPFHPDRNPSMTVYVGQGTFYCFACGAWGDVFDCVGQYFGLDRFRAQVDKLAWATPDVPETLFPHSRPPKGREQRNNPRRRASIVLRGGKAVVA